jgi:hypothetical protein
MHAQACMRVYVHFSLFMYAMKDEWHVEKPSTKGQLASVSNDQ